MDTRKLRPDFNARLMEQEAIRLESGSEPLFLPPSELEFEPAGQESKLDVSWLELTLYWLSELKWWRSYWNREKN